MRKPLLLLIALVCLPWALPAAAAKVTVMGLFKDRAVLLVDGQRRVLSLGESSPEGVKLVSADADGAVLEIEGSRRRYTLGTDIDAAYAARAEKVVRLWPDGSGMYTTTGSINGMPVGFLVDTGATFIAMNAGQAQRLGISFRVDGKRGSAETASGVEQVYKVQLNTVKVGEIRLNNVAAVVFEGNQPSQVLLGMSFLSRVAMEHEGEALLLRKKF